MSDFPNGGSVQQTRAWLDDNDFHDKFTHWNADVLFYTRHGPNG